MGSDSPLHFSQYTGRPGRGRGITDAATRDETKIGARLIIEQNAPLVAS